jgi:hypothetical protein
LQVAEVSVALGKSCEKLALKRELRAGLDRVEAVLLVDRLPAHDRPALRALLEESRRNRPVQTASTCTPSTVARWLIVIFVCAIARWPLTSTSSRQGNE